MLRSDQSSWRRIKLAVLHAASALGLFALSRKVTRSGVRVLCYHGVWMGSESFRGDSMFISAETFRRRLELINRLGYPVIPLSDAVDVLSGKRAVPSASVVITIDDGWYSTYAIMLPVLLKAGMPATLYCDTGHLLWGQAVPHIMAKYIWELAGPADAGSSAQIAYENATNFSLSLSERLEAANELARLLDFDVEKLNQARAVHYMSADELRDLFRQGVDVQLHTDNHSLHDMSPVAVEEEVLSNRRELVRLLGAPSAHFEHFCYPSGVTSTSAVAALEKLGITSSATLDPGLNYPGQQRQLIRRFADGEQVSAIEFEAELSGFNDFVRVVVSGFARFSPSGKSLRSWQWRPERRPVSQAVEGDPRGERSVQQHVTGR